MSEGVTLERRETTASRCNLLLDRIAEKYAPKASGASGKGPVALEAVGLTASAVRRMTADVPRAPALRGRKSLVDSEYGVPMSGRRLVGRKHPPKRWHLEFAAAALQLMGHRYSAPLTTVARGAAAERVGHTLSAARNFLYHRFGTLAPKCVELLLMLEEHGERYGIRYR